MGKILFIAPHPDDETLGCGGTILKHKAAGEEIYWLIVTNISVEEGFKAAKVKERQEEIKKVAKEYGFERVFKLDLPAIKLDVIPKSHIVKTVSNIINEVEPNIVYIPYRNDVHSDHKITFDAVISSTKTFRCPSINKILMYEVISETEFTPALPNNIFNPNCFSDISEYLSKKISIMQIYKGEMGKHPFPRSVENLRALATFRGATAGVKYAEAFNVLRETW